MQYLEIKNPSRTNIKHKMFIEGYKEYKCELCGISEWRGVPIPLDLHHKDCDEYNNSYDNLILLCPNCHSIQKGHYGANKGRYSIKEYSKDVLEHPYSMFTKDEKEKRIRDKELQKIENIKKRVEQVIFTDVDFTQYGWVSKVCDSHEDMWSMRSKLTNFLREYAPEFMNMCFDYKRDRPHTYDRTNEERRCQV